MRTPWCCKIILAIIMISPSTRTARRKATRDTAVTVSQTHVPFQLEAITAGNWQIYAADICALEADVYEPARRLARDEMARFARDPHGLCAVALAGGDVAGFAFAGPLEWFADVAGVLQDPEWGRGTTLYSAD